MFLKIVSFDLEIVPLNINKMPLPEESPIVLASCHFNYSYRIEGTETQNVVLILTSDYKGVEKWNDKVVIFYTSEKELIYKLYEILKDNDVITGYNINNFDIVYLIDRSKVLGIRNVNIGLGDGRLYHITHLSKGFTVTKIGGITGKIVFDVLALFKREDASNVFLKKYNLRKLTLEHVSKEILKNEKLEFNINEMIEYWKDTSNIELRNKFIEYCSKDSELPLLFITKFRLLDKFFALAKVSGRLSQEIINSQGSGIMVENLLLKEFKLNDRVMAVRMHSDSVGNDLLLGAFVLDPKLGITDNVGSLDFTSLYSSIMIKYNLSYDTLVEMSMLSSLKKLGLTEDDIEVQYNEDGDKYAVFVKKEKYKGIVPAKLEKFLELRASLKKDMKKYEKGTSEYLMLDSTQEAVKILLNSHYGYAGDSSAKVYSWLVASAVTTNGRIRIKKTINTINNMKIMKDDYNYSLNVIMSDTDSTYVNVTKGLSAETVSRDDVIYCVNHAANEINLTLERPMKLAFENYIKRILIVAKKRYGMFLVDDNGKESVKVKGLETIRRDWCLFATDNMSKVIEFVLTSPKVEDGVNKSVDLIKEQAKALKKGNVILNSLVLSNKLTKPITSYDNKEAHVMVAIKMKERGKPSEIGDRIQFFITDNGKKLVSERAEEAEYVINHLNEIKIDNNYYIYNQLLPPSLRVLELLGVNKDTLIARLDDAQKGLDEFW